MYLLRHIHELDEIPTKFMDPLFSRLFMLAEISNFTPEEYNHYLKSLESMGDYANIIQTAIDETESRCREEERLQNAKNLKALGVDLDIIAQGLGLDKKTVEEL